MEFRSSLVYFHSTANIELKEKMDLLYDMYMKALYLAYHMLNCSLLLLVFWGEEKENLHFGIL